MWRQHDLAEPALVVLWHPVGYHYALPGVDAKAQASKKPPMTLRTFTVSVRGETLGTFTCEPDFFDQGQLKPQEGVAYFCSACGEIWASIKAEDIPSHAVTIPCKEHHSSPHWPGGSIWLTWNKRLMDLLPREVLLREFMRHEELEKELKS